ncbi:MAG: L,D-transpeptidase family protein [Eggerthellaceae bacterium]|nr:L,D-transpeptidase family protein [Eggerthellaceae bacterium]
MFSKLGRVVFSLVLCLSLIPLVGVTAWADEDGKIADQVRNDDVVGNEGEEIADQVRNDEDARGDEVVGDEGEDARNDESNEDALGDESDEAANSDAIEVSPTAAGYSVEYRAHVAKEGWKSWVADGKLAGTTGKSRSIEALEIKLKGSGLKGSVEYRTHVQSKGWEPSYTNNGKTSGTTGRGLRTEAINIRLTGEVEQAYDIYYRVHVQGFGWLGWAKNGERAGSSGYSYRMEALEIRLVEKGKAEPTSTVATAFKKPDQSLIARSHVQNVGWQGWVTEGKTTGTIGRGYRMEALCLQVANTDYSGSIEYRAHVSSVGWQGWKANGGIAGTTGQARQVEAVQVRLTGELAEIYDVYYRAHSANTGWLGWAKNGEVAGITGVSCRMEAMQVRLVDKGGKAPGSTDNHTLELAYTSQGHSSGKGWLSQGSGRRVVGTTGQGRALEAFKLSVSGSLSGGIEYNAFVKGIGWQGWKHDGAIVGTEGQSRRIEAIRIRLTGDLANYFEVCYRAHSTNWGWLGWARSGANAGTYTVGYALEAFEIAVVVKGAPAPGSTSHAYTNKSPIPPTHAAMNNRVANISSPTNWLIAIDSSNCLVGVYYGSKGNWTNKYMWLCSPGARATPTVKGLYSIGSRGYVFGSGFSCYYWTQFYGDYLFHSVLYYPGTRTIMEGVMGVPASHGCVRLDINNAKWIYDNIPSRTTVVSY